MDFEEAAARLEGAINSAAEGEEEWPARVAAAIYAAIDFARLNRPLASEPWLSRADGSVGYEDLIDRFARRLGSGAPRQGRPSTERATLRCVAAIIIDSLHADDDGRMERTGQELVQLVLLPYLGFEEAKRWAERTRRSDA